MARAEQLLELLKQQPNDSFVLFALAKEYQKANELEKALFYFKELKDKQPEYTGLYYHLGKTLELADRPDDALKVYEEGIAICLKVGAHHDKGELDGAITLLEMNS